MLPNLEMWVVGNVSVRDVDSVVLIARGSEVIITAFFYNVPLLGAGTVASVLLHCCTVAFAGVIEIDGFTRLAIDNSVRTIGIASEAPVLIIAIVLLEGLEADARIIGAVYHVEEIVSVEFRGNVVSSIGDFIGADGSNAIAELPELVAVAVAVFPDLEVWIVGDFTIGNIDSVVSITSRSEVIIVAIFHDVPLLGAGAIGSVLLNPITVFSSTAAEIDGFTGLLVDDSVGAIGVIVEAPVLVLGVVLLEGLEADTRVIGAVYYIEKIFAIDLR